MAQFFTSKIHEQDQKFQMLCFALHLIRNLGYTNNISILTICKVLDLLTDSQYQFETFQNWKAELLILPECIIGLTKPAG